MPAWSLAPIVGALRALRGVDLIVAVTFVDARSVTCAASTTRGSSWAISAWCRASARPATPCGAVASPRPVIGRVRHMLVESAWTYRHPPRLGEQKLYILEKVPPQGPRDRLEGTDPADRSLSRTGWAGQEDDGGLHRHCSGARRLHVVGRHGRRRPA